MRIATLAWALAFVIVAGGCGAGRRAATPTKQRFVAQADRICAGLPTTLGATGNGTGSAILVMAARRYADRFGHAASALRRLALPPPPDGQGAAAFVAAMMRVEVAVERERSAFERYVPADPTDAIAVGNSFREIETVGVQVDRREREADAAAAGYGFRSCGRLRAASSGPTTAPYPTITRPPPAFLTAAGRAAFLRGRAVAEDSGCLACHRIDGAGNGGPGPDLSKIGERISPDALTRVLRQPTAPMPSYASIPRQKLSDLVAFLAALRSG